MFFTKTFISNVGNILISSAAMGGVTYLLIRFVFPLLAGETGFFTLAPKFSAIVLISMSIYVFVGSQLRLPEALVVSSRLKRIINQRVQIG